MPTYQYACTDTECGNRFELVQAFTDPAASDCPVCGGPVRKVFSAVGVVFKGSGFYRTDSRAAAKSSNGSGRKGSTSSESAGSSSSTESSASGSSGSSGTSGSSASSASSGESKPAKSGGSSDKVAASA